MSPPVERLTAALSGRYRVERELGEGGMATVYLARDVKHDRDVALKVLKPELAAAVGGDRFLAEIQVTARLQHPNILPLFDSGEAGGFLFYVMPYVEGESLRERLDREKELPVEEAVRIAAEVAEALAHAHDRGIVHRDVKPANVLLRDGRPLVADFGIALAVSAAGGGRLTETGLSVGTPYYMSPEQASGDRVVDARADVYALSCVLYEMLTGEPPFTGPTAQAVLGRVLMGDPEPPTEHRPTVPAHVEAVVLKGLERIPADRLPSAEVFARALRDPGYARTVAVPRRPGDASPETRRWRRLALGAVAAAAALLAALGWAVLGGAGDDGPGGADRHRIALGSGVEHLPGNVGLHTALAPDGSGILFADTLGAERDPPLTFWWKARGSADPVPVPEMAGAISVAFSPDAQRVVFLVDGELRTRAMAGSATLTVADSIEYGVAHALAWLEDGTIVFEDSDFAMRRIAADGSGTAETVTTLERVGYPIHASAMIDHGGFLLTSCTMPRCPTSHLHMVDLERDTVVRLADDVARAWQVEGGRVLYVDRTGTLLAADLDVGALALGPVAPILEDVRVSFYFAEIQIAPVGTALFVRGEGPPDWPQAVWVDRAGTSAPVDPDWGPEPLTDVLLSPGGDRVAVGIQSEPGAEQNIWVKELPGGPLTRLTRVRSVPVAWDSAGRTLIYVTPGEDGQPYAASLPADGRSSSPDTVLDLPEAILGVAVTAEGGLVVRTAPSPEAGADIRYLPAHRRPATGGPDPSPVDLVATDFHERGIQLSPDGRWLAYVSDIGGQDEVFVRPFPDAGSARVQISRGGGRAPVWSADGNELFYRSTDGRMVAAQLSAGPTFAVDSRVTLFETDGFAAAPAASGRRFYDVAPDGRFLMLRRWTMTDRSLQDLIFVENVLAGLGAGS